MNKISSDAESSSAPGGKIAVVMKGYPRLSETFIAQELLALQRLGLRFDIWSLRQPYDPKTHPMHAQIKASVHYLPEYLHNDPLRVLRGLASALLKPRFWRLLSTWLRDLRRDLTANRVRRFGQALVLARELPVDTAALYVHFLHTPASVTRYAAVLRGLPWGFSAHAKDIWTIPDWEISEKIAASQFGATCTAYGAEKLMTLADQSEKISLIYHGIDISRFPSPPERNFLVPDGSNPFTILSVGRLVEKKGYDLLLQALAALPADLNWRFVHIGGGELKDASRNQANALGVSGKIEWMGARDQSEVIEALRAADLFVLPSRVAKSGDRDGLPNVLMEAASQKLPILSTAVAAIPEFIDDGVHGRLVASGEAAPLTDAIVELALAPDQRRSFADAAYDRLVTEFATDPGIERLLRHLVALTAVDASPGDVRVADTLAQ